jgi:hypothetical protein
MEYVMVPVPEELVTDTKMFLMGLDLRTTAARDGEGLAPETVDRMLNALNARSRTALSHLATASLAGRHLTMTDLSAITGWTVHDAAGVVTELNALVWEAFGPLMAAVGDTPDVDRGTLNWDERRVVIWRELASVVVAADEAAAGGG